MLFSLLYFLVRRVLGAGGRQHAESDIELLMLRRVSHQVKVLQVRISRVLDTLIRGKWTPRFAGNGHPGC